MLTDAEVMKELEDAEAILRGHFILSSGLHSDTYLQCARVLMNPKRAEKLCGALAEKVRMTLAGIDDIPPTSGGRLGGGHGDSVTPTMPPRAALTMPPPQPSPDGRGRTGIDLVVAPAMGGVVVGYEMGRQLGVETIFCERESGEFTLRRGFRIEPGAKILLVEDVVTTGKSSLEAVECIKRHGGAVVAEASLIDRSGGESAKLPFPLVSLLTVHVASFSADHVPDHLKDVPAIKPGSRWLQKQA
jgi:orotate phosphoribosyltransferase